VKLTGLRLGINGFIQIEHLDSKGLATALLPRDSLEELGMLRSLYRSRVSNANPYSESLFRTIKYRPDYPSKPFASKDQACLWIIDFVD